MWKREDSQRVTDLVLRAFQAAGASQGTCNNLTCGYGGQLVNGVPEPGFGYYEVNNRCLLHNLLLNYIMLLRANQSLQYRTIAGGAGAAGQSGVHVHRTNRQITDPDSLERQYPCILHEFSTRKNSGGNGCTRDIEFRRDVDVSVLSERRTVPPYGMCGEAVQVGENIWLRHDEFGLREISLGGKNTCRMRKGDRVIIRSSGGGGYGKKVC